MLFEPPDLTLEVDSSAESLTLARMVVRSALQETCTADDLRLRSILVAFTEILTNALDAQRRAGVRDPIRVEMRHPVEGLVEIAVRDRGAGFAAPEGNGVDPETSQGLGLGLVIAAELVDDVEAERVGDQTVVSLRIRADLRES